MYDDVTLKVEMDPNKWNFRPPLHKLDHIEDISYHQTKHPVMNIHAHSDLKAGLIGIAQSLNEYERKFEKDNAEQLSGQIFFPGGLPASGELTCLFHWYANTLINYLRLIGFIQITYSENISLEDYKKKNNNQIRKMVKKHCSDYVKKVSPDILIWRNKVSAHFSLTDPQEDSLSTIMSSVRSQINWHDNRLTAVPGMIKFSEEETKLPVWSVTKNFENLSSRLWPEINLNG